MISKIIRAWKAQIAKDYTTKSGEPIWMSFQQNIRPRKDDPWVLHQVNAFLPSETETVGYLVISYIPKAKWLKRYPTIWHYANLSRGMVTVNPKAPPQEIWREVGRYRGNFWSSGNMEADLRRWSALLRKEMAEAMEFHVDKPMVDFIRVREDLRGQGIGRALYLFGARELAKMGFPLYASGIQSDEAKLSWKKFEEQGLVKKRMKTKHQRRMLDFRDQ